MKVFFVPQTSPEWWTLKQGKVSCSNLDRIITSVKGDLSKSADEYMAELIAETFLPSASYFSEKGVPANSYAIQQGVALEPEARRWMSFDAGLDVTEVGFVMTDDFRWGGSPDGCIGLEVEPESGGEWRGIPWFSAKAKAILELKVPLPKTQAAYLLKGEIPSDYRQQLHGHLAVSGCEWVEFVSYSNVLPPLRLQVYPDAYTEKLKAALGEFHDRYDAALAKIKEMS